MKALEDSARALIAAHRNGQAIAADPHYAPRSAAEAYAVQQAVWAGLTNAPRATAWKVAVPPHAEPIAGPVLPDRLAASPACFERTAFLSPGIEAELAVRFGRDLPSRGVRRTLDEIRDAIESLHVAIEIVDTRLADPDGAGPLWRLADNLVNGALVIGAPVANWRTLTFSEAHVRVTLDGHTVADRVATPPIEDLLAGLPWWLQHVGGAHAGDIVTTGAWTGMHPLDDTTSVHVAFGGFGVADLSLR